MAVYFPDIEKLLIAYLVDELENSSDPVAADVRVGAVKLPADAVRPSKEVVIVGAYNRTLDPVRRAASAVIEVHADTYDEASRLALLVAALVVGCTDGAIKRAVVTLGPVRLIEASEQEKRSLTVDLVVKGSNI